MASKPVELRQRADEDIDAAIDHYQREGGAPLALRFIDALERVLAQLADHPQIGSLRVSYEVDIPDLRVWPLPRFPYLVFYLDRADRVDVWRVLHAHRDIPTWLSPLGSAEDAPE